MLKSRLADQYNPLFFLAALGAGGLAVSFFLYPMFLIKHPDAPMVTFNHLWPLLTGDNPLIAALLALVLAVIAFLAFLHVRLLIWNLREYALFKQTQAYTKLLSSNAEISLMAIPLTLAMSVNVMFVLGALFVPNLWSVVEWLFPGAILAFLAIGAYAMRILVTYFARVLSQGGVDFASNNSLAPMIAIFALAMIAVGLAAPAAMSHIKAVQAISIVLSLFFFSAAALLAVIKLVLGFKAMMEHGISEAASPSLWILIPILTLLGITWIRLSHGLHHGFEAHGSPTSLFVLSAAVLSMQILFGLIGWAVMRRLGYFEDYVRGDKGNAGTFALICPGVAFFVFGLFFITVGLVQTGLVAHLSPLYFALMLPFVLVQLKTVQVMFHIKRNILHVKA
ncbi:MAG: TsoY family (seleno)protein [Pseudomonadota bacterium]